MDGFLAWIPPDPVPMGTFQWAPPDAAAEPRPSEPPLSARGRRRLAGPRGCQRAVWSAFGERGVLALLKVIFICVSVAVGIQYSRRPHSA